jgi:hypothetical protein
VAAADDTHRGRRSLGEYYEQKGESPGVWLGSGLSSLAGDLPASVVGGTVAEEQMFALFGLGRHPNDRAIARELMSAGASLRVMDGATKLGHAYHGYEPSKFQAALAARYREHNTARGARADAAIPARPVPDSDRTSARMVPSGAWPRPVGRPGVHRLPDACIASCTDAGGRL